MNEKTHKRPTKEELIQHFKGRIWIRKPHPIEAFRLMDVEDEDIMKLYETTEEYKLKDDTVKTRKAISKTALFKLAGNSIVVSCIYHIFRTLFIPNQPENN